MKKILLSFLSLVIIVSCFAQQDYTKRSALGIHFIANDFKTAALLKTSSLSNVLQTKKWSKTGDMAAGLGISYIKGLSNNVDFETSLAGSFLDYPIPGKTLTGNSYPLFEAVATGNLKLLSDKYWVTPFLTAGVGASEYRGYYAAIAPVGVGLQLNLYDEAFILINSQYRIPITENAAAHFYNSIGIAGNIGKEKVAPIMPSVTLPTIEKPKDRDGDGVADDVDKCPDVAGLASLNGCPDTDGDGIADGDDKCPNVAGLLKYQGCPIPDTDGDGINDEQDKCPSVKGVARFQGCPVPDTDNDGVNDEEDKCPNEAGPASNFGCPVIDKAVIDKINYAANNIFFASGSAKLLPKSFVSLNEVVKIMANDKSIKLDIDGYTDNQGKADKNQLLSESRANAVKAYLMSKGLDESRILSAVGHGQDQPIADNKTAIGRAKNRRVQLKVKNY